MTERTCTTTGLHLVAAGGQTAYRVAKDRYGALSARRNEHVGPPPVGSDPGAGDSRGRYDTIGSTLYLADSRRCAYAEVLNGFRAERAQIARTAQSIGMAVDEYIETVSAEARANGVDVPWSVSVDWQLERSIYEIRLPRQGWWVRIDHPDTLNALENLASATAGAMGEVTMLTATEVTGPNRDLTTLLAHVIRQQMLDDGHEPLGIVYPSRTLTGTCWAYWDRRADENLPPGRNDLLQVTSQNVGPDPAFADTAQYYRLPILGAR
ncbi:RES domain-containing protein [Citricoccus sp. SGAir0253]|uniref:RES domain-containing protein n=1 Tax=Citricoccus sp. SGAir0253 TaxID=2567881 RepID=UPI00143D48AE|nr:RES domain-containing protein [Citricoccus sp. SGAir0253]